MVNNDLLNGPSESVTADESADTDVTADESADLELDIQLTLRDALELLESAKSSRTQRHRRKIMDDSQYLWQLPIKYTFDGTQCKFLLRREYNNIDM